MQRFRKRLLMLLMLISAVSFAMLTDHPFGNRMTHVQAAKVSLSNTKVTLDVEETLRLKVNGTSKKVTWSSSDTSVVKVYSTGLIRARKIGTADICAKVGTRSYICKVTVRKLPVNSNNIVKKYLTKNPCYTCGAKIKVKGLMLHSVGEAQPSAMAYVNKWNSPSYDRACVHAFIDARSGVVYQTLPWNRRGWHCGGSGNDTHIGVEMCEPAGIKYTSSTTFVVTDREAAVASAKITYDAAVNLFAYLCRVYHLDPLEDGVIVSHNEGRQRGIATSHIDPEHFWKGLGLSYTMDGFRQDVNAALGGFHERS